MKRFIAALLLFSQIASGAGILVPPFKNANSTDLEPRSTSISNIYGNTQGFALSCGGTAAPTAQLDVLASSSTKVGQILKAASSQSADIWDVEDSSGNIMDSVDSAGRLHLSNSTFSFTGAYNAVQIGGTGGTINNIGGNIYTAISNASSVTENQSTAFAVPFFGVNSQQTTTMIAPGGIMTEPTSYYASPTNIANGTVWTGADAFGSFVDLTTFSVSNGGSFSAMVHDGFVTNLTINSGATVATRRGAYILDATGAGVLTTQHGLVINDLTKGSTNVPIYVKGPGASSGSVHVPKIEFGADSTAVAKVDIGGGNLRLLDIAVQFQTTINLDPTTANVFSISPATANATINLSSTPPSGQEVTIIVTCDAVSTHTMTFGTHINASGTEACGGTSKTFVWKCVSNGVSCYEASKTNGL